MLIMTRLYHLRIFRVGGAIPWRKFLFTISFLVISVSFLFSQNSVSQNDPVQVFLNRLQLKDNPGQVDEILFAPFERILQKMSPVKDNHNTRDELMFYPDTVSINCVFDTDHKNIYTYNDQQLLVNVLTIRLEDGNWVNDVNEQYVYDEDGNVTERLWQVWDGELGEWVNESRSTYFYDEGNLISYISEQWQNNVWQYQYRSDYTYTLSNQISTELFQYWNEGVWVNGNKTIFTYDEQDRLINLLKEEWYASAWRNAFQTNYEYDESGRLSKIVNIEWVDGLWVNQNRQNYTYSDDFMLSYVLGETWEDSTWINNYEKYFYYNDVGMLEYSVRNKWLNDNWIPLQRESYSYGSYGNIESELQELWVNDQWENNSLQQYSYDENGNCLTADYFLWDGGLWTQNSDGPLTVEYNYGTRAIIMVGYHVDASYQSIWVGTRSNDQLADQQKISCYPNPVKDELNLQINWQNTAEIEIEVLNEAGKLIKSFGRKDMEKGSSLIKLGLSDVPAGVLFIKIGINNRKTIKKLIKLNN